MRPSLALPFLAIVASVAPGAALPESRTWSLPHLMAEMAKRQGGAVRFTERRHFKLLSEPLTIEGVLRFEGNRLEKHNLKPDEERVIIEGARVTITSPARNRKDSVYLSDIPALEVFVTGLRATLRGDLTLLKRSFWVKYAHDGPDWKMSLTPLDEDAVAVVREVRLAGREIRIATVEVVEASGDRSLIQLLHE